MSEYDALRVRQKPGSEGVILFGAPCHEILAWAGIPRKEAKDGVQTIGFQRAEVPDRVTRISEFLQTENNIIPNPILVAVRDRAKFSFTADVNKGVGQVEVGTLRIATSEDADTLVCLLERAVTLLESRLERLREYVPSDVDIRDFLQEQVESSELPDAEPDADIDVVEREDLVDEEQGEEGENYISFSTGVSFSTESHIDDFYRALKLRLAALKRVGGLDRDDFAGISKSILRDYLKPTFVVDGQHRLLGANKELEQAIQDSPQREVIRLLTSGASEAEAETTLRKQHARVISVALIDNPDWSEHVFQFVVVNQKATPIPRALLASIVATTLSDEEIGRIRDRLKRSGIPVEDYITISYLNSSPDSPFRGLIKRGYGEVDGQKKLDMTVVDRLVTMFRDLKGGRPFERRPQDYAAVFRSARLQNFRFLDDYDAKGFSDRFEYWRSADGPWREVFCVFWSTVRDLCASQDDPSAGNMWGYPKKSNLFNGVHLHILASDFFQFLYSRSPEIKAIDEFPATVRDQWLEFVKARAKEYFARDWRLQGVKKTDGTVRQKWTELWRQFREDPRGRLPQVTQYRS